MTIHHRSLDGGRGDFSSPGVSHKYPPDLGLEPVHLELQLQLDIPGRTATGEVTHTLAIRDPRQRQFTLQAVDLHDVVVFDPDGAELDFDYDGDRIDVHWTEASEGRDSRRLTVRWRVENPITGLHFSSPDDEHPDAPLFAATDHETERARYWLPCVDHPQVRTTLDVSIRADGALTALSNGAEDSKTEHDDGTATTRWVLEQRCPSYLLCLAVGDFVRADGGEVDGIPIAFFAPRTFSEADLLRSFAPTAPMLTWLQGRLGSKLPYPKYFQFAVPGIGGAMENISLVSWDDRWIADERLHAERGWLLDLINVHEMAHSWFGDAIVCRDFSHVWLKESWATYIESVWLEETEGVDAMHYQLHDELRAYRSEADRSYVRPIVTREFDSSWDMFDRHLYPGGAVRLHLLRTELGDDAFWAGVRDYVARFSGEVAETDDFRRCLERASGRSLARFFDEWFRSPGYPKLKASFTYDRKSSEAWLKIEQTQVDAAAGVGLFHFDLDVAVEVEDGNWARGTLAVDGANASLLLPLRKRPLQVVLDPEGKVPCSLDFQPGSEMLRRSLKHCPWVPGRIHAAVALARAARRKNVRALRDALRTEAVWGVRLVLARALGEAGTAEALDALVKLLPAEEDPRVMSTFCDALARYRDPAVAEALISWLESERPYVATAQALKALGAQRGDLHLDRLREALADESWWGWVQRGALSGLAETRSPAVLDELIRATQTGRIQVRWMATMALGECGRWQTEPLRARALEALTDLGRDPDYSLRRISAQAIKVLGDPSAAPQLDRVAGTLAEQDVPAVHRIANSLRKGELGAARTLGRQVDKLEEQLRKMRKRLETLEARAAKG